MSSDVVEEERQRILRHAETCESCSELRHLHEGLESATLPEPPENDLLEVRRGVLRNLQTEAIGGERRDVWSWFELPIVKTALTTLSMIALLAVGFAAGRAGSLESEGFEGSITGSIERSAAGNLDLAQSRESPFTYSNVRLQTVDSETVRLGFDVATHLDLVRAKNDPLVAEVLVQSLVTPASVGTRLEAIDLVGSPEPKVRDALVVAMLDDPNLAVRLKALSKLTASGPDPATQAALLQVLRSETSVTMRLLAIDHLTTYEVPAEALRTALEQGRPEPGTAVYAKAEKYLRVF
jgi:hypothetical protein